MSGDFWTWFWFCLFLNFIKKIKFSYQSKLFGENQYMSLGQINVTSGRCDPNSCTVATHLIEKLTDCFGLFFPPSNLNWRSDINLLQGNFTSVSIHWGTTLPCIISYLWPVRSYITDGDLVFLWSRNKKTLSVHHVVTDIYITRQQFSDVIAFNYSNFKKWY